MKITSIMNWRLLVLAITFTAGLLTSQAYASTMKELLEQAFDTADGNATALLDGDPSDLIRRAMPIQGDITAQVKTIKTFKEKDCRRFAISFLAKFAPESGHTGPVPLPGLELNYCKGGGFPQEGVDPEAGRKFMDLYREHGPRENQSIAPSGKPPARDNPPAPATSPQPAPQPQPRHG